ncbi:MAG: UDP-N-acetylmuramate dehydrogenase [Cryomorphaceae bacterium]|nr:UDP-N-acetylmuramate dehydrogenase [Cryomorphaceae bacterium]
MVVKENASLKSLNTFGLDVVAARYARITSREELYKIKELPKPWFFLGGGSNILFTRDFPGTIIHIDLRGRGIDADNGNDVLVYGMAGENWHEFVRYTLQLDLGGIENLSLIPGNLGTAPVQNIGAYGVEIKDVFHELEAFDTENGEFVKFNAQDCQFDYRQSFFKQKGKGRYIITKVVLKLSRKHKLHTGYGAITSELENMGIHAPDIHDISRAVVRIRMSKLPDPAMLGNCGSFFKNPVVSKEKAESLLKKHPEMPSYPVSDTETKIPAGWLIEQCGWKGKAEGNASMHKQQALVLINLGNASGAELYAHAQRVKQSVKAFFDIQLEEEVNVL